MAIKVQAILLAGGKSTRMGEDKALLSIEDKRLVDFMAEKLEAATTQPVLLSGNIDGFNSVADNYKDAGPLAGIEASFKVLSDNIDYLLVCPVDMPNISVELLKNLIKEAKTSEKKVLIYKEFLFPLIIPKKTYFYDKICNCLNKETSRERSIRAFIKSVDVENINIIDTPKSYFLNTNTPSQWQDFIKDFKNED